MNCEEACPRSHTLILIRRFVVPGSFLMLLYGYERFLPNINIVVNKSVHTQFSTNFLSTLLITVIYFFNLQMQFTRVIASISSYRTKLRNISSVISKRSDIAKNVEIGPFCVIEDSKICLNIKLTPKMSF